MEKNYKLNDQDRALLFLNKLTELTHECEIKIVSYFPVDNLCIVNLDNSHLNTPSIIYYDEDQNEYVKEDDKSG